MLKRCSFQMDLIPNGVSGLVNVTSEEEFVVPNENEQLNHFTSHYQSRLHISQFPGKESAVLGVTSYI